MRAAADLEAAMILRLLAAVFELRLHGNGGRMAPPSLPLRDLGRSTCIALLKVLAGRQTQEQFFALVEDAVPQIAEGHEAQMFREWVYSPLLFGHHDLLVKQAPEALQRLVEVRHDLARRSIAADRSTELADVLRSLANLADLALAGAAQPSLSLAALNAKAPLPELRALQLWKEMLGKSPGTRWRPSAWLQGSKTRPPGRSST